MAFDSGPVTKLSVNINKIALLRNARGRNFPDVAAFSERFLALGSDGITLHPRPDQRHARYADVAALKAVVRRHPGAELNVEGNPTPEFMAIVRREVPDQCTLVPDEPGQLTSDHGWDLVRHRARLKELCRELRESGIRVSLFVDFDNGSIPLARELGADRVELYTEPYAEAFGTPAQERVLDGFRRAAAVAQAAGLGVNAGHDLNLDNLAPFLAIPSVLEVSIGHALTVECLEHGIEAVTRRYVAIAHGAPAARREAR
jgi:pyridoxine 5-phosphate synthase